MTGARVGKLDAEHTSTNTAMTPATTPLMLVPHATDPEKGLHDQVFELSLTCTDGGIMSSGIFVTIFICLQVEQATRGGGLSDAQLIAFCCFAAGVSLEMAVKVQDAMFDYPGHCTSYLPPSSCLRL